MTGGDMRPRVRFGKCNRQQEKEALPFDNEQEYMHQQIADLSKAQLAIVIAFPEDSKRGDEAIMIVALWN
jgi:hypothetical protein